MVTSSGSLSVCMSMRRALLRETHLAFRVATSGRTPTDRSNLWEDSGSSELLGSFGSGHRGHDRRYSELTQERKAITKPRLANNRRTRPIERTAKPPLIGIPVRRRGSENKRG